MTNARGGYKVVNLEVSGPHGPVPIRAYLPSAPARFGLLWVHGGGFRVGDLDMPEADWASRSLAELGIVVVSVGYRLAVGGVHFPIPVDDVHAAWQWAHTANDVLPPELRWSIGGGSAGATLAQSVTMRLRSQSELMPARVALVYPSMHARLPDAPEELKRKRRVMPPPMRFEESSVLEHGLHYAGSETLMNTAFPGEAPTEELQGLPPTLIVNSDLDDLRASGQRFAVQLIEAGTDVAVIRELGVFHGHLAFPSFPQATTTLARVADWVTGSAIPGEAHTDDRNGWALPRDAKTIWEQDLDRVQAELHQAEHQAAP